MRSANSCGWKSSISGSFPLRNAINDCYDINVTEECEIWHHLSPVLLRRHVLWVLGSADRAGRKKKRRERWKLGDDNAVTLLPNSCTYSLLCPWSKFKEGECGSRGRKYSEKLAKIVTLWLTEGAQLPQKRTQTLRAGMNLHCSQAGIVRTMQKITFSLVIIKHQLCREIRTPKNSEFRLRGVVGEDRFLWQNVNSITSYQGR